MQYDAVIVGSGPNGLAAAITLARAGRSVLVYEANDTIGGGARSAELTLPGFIHDTCSAIQPLAVASPFFRELPLNEFGLEWIYPPAALAHPLDDGSAVVLERSVRETSEHLGRDGAAYRLLMSPLVNHFDELMVDLLGPLPFPPKNFLTFTQFGLRALWPAHLFFRSIFREKRARAVMSGLTAHSMLSLDSLITASFGMALGVTAHAVGWPMAKGGSQKISDALGAYLRKLGGEIITGRRVESLDELPTSRTIFFDLTPRQIVKIARSRLPEGYIRALESFRYGPGVFKLDWALSQPIPWKAKECFRAATVHLGPRMEDIVASERAVWRGEPSDKPFVLVVQQSLFDSTRAPEGKHTAWAYCHVPNGSTLDMTDRIEGQIERFAPGFRDCILARNKMDTAAIESRNANYVGGDINGGAQDILQLYTRPAWRFNPYSTPVKGLYICSSSTPPGGGVHGMSGYHAARAAIRDGF